MKKFLAMFLACVMVLSMLSVTTFAAEETHSHCPGADVLHNTENCPDAIEGETVAPKCGTYGYTLYECKECGADFAGKFVKPVTEHNMVETTAKVEATCTEDGAEAIETCSICGAVEGGDVIPATKHVWGEEAVSGSCKEGYTYKCTKCDATEVRKSQNDDHTWNKMPVILEEPESACDRGVAQYTCTVCGETKKVDIQNLPCDLEDVAEDPATCTETGVEAHQKCKVCNRLYQDGEEVTAADLEIPAKNHPAKNTWTKGDKISDFSCTTDEVYEVTCPKCGAEDTLVTKEAAHTYHETPELTVDATCTTWGYTFYACKYCKHWEKKEEVAPLDHTPFECEDHATADANCKVCKDAALTPANSKNTVQPTCTEKGKNIWKCGRCGIDKDAPIDPLTCDEKTVTVDATCKKFGYSFTYCARANCDCETCEAAGAPVSTYVKDGVTYDVTVDGKPVWLHSFEIVDAKFNPDKHVEDPAKSYWVNEATCTKDGNKMFYCLDCQWVELVEVKAFGHDYDDGVVTNAHPNAQKYAKVYTCERELEDGTPCNHSYTEWITVQHTYGAAVKVDPTCKDQGYNLYTCTCGYTKKDTWVPKVAYDPEHYYASEADMLKVHKNVDVNAKVVKNPGNCVTLGLYSYYCADCQKYQAVVIPGTGTGHAEPKTNAEWARLIADYYGASIVGAPADGQKLDMNLNGILWQNPIAPTCVEDGRTAGYVCPTCNTYVASTVKKAAGEHKIKIDVAAKPATCTEPGHTGSSHCENCDEVTIVGTVINPKLHMNSVCVDGAEVSCTQFGYTHTMCNWCKYEIIIGYEKALGHTELVVDEDASYDKTCTENGLKVEVCERPGCNHKVETVLTAEGHKNEAGQTLIDSCTNNVEDRDCVNCGAEGELIGKSHSDAYYTGVVFPATCVEYGYTLKVCETCGLREVIEDTIKEYGPHIWKNDKDAEGWTVTLEPTFHAEGTKVRECKNCDHSETEQIAVKTGMGLTMDIVNAATGNTAFSDSSLVKVTVSVDANKVDAWSYNFVMNYNDTLLDFVKAEFTGSVFNVNNAYTNATNAKGAVMVTGTYPNTETGKLQNKNVDDELVLVDLYFRVTCANDAEVSFNISNIEFYNKDSKAATDKAVETEAAKILIDKYLDVNNDGDFTPTDAQIAYKILVGQPLDGTDIVTYDVTIDINKDGKITSTDVQMLYNYLVGNLKYEDMVK